MWLSHNQCAKVVLKPFAQWFVALFGWELHYYRDIILLKCSLIIAAHHSRTATRGQPRTFYLSRYGTSNCSTTCPRAVATFRSSGGRIKRLSGTNACKNTLCHSSCRKIVRRIQMKVDRFLRSLLLLSPAGWTDALTSSYKSDSTFLYYTPPPYCIWHISSLPRGIERNWYLCNGSVEKEMTLMLLLSCWTPNEICWSYINRLIASYCDEFHTIIRKEKSDHWSCVWIVGNNKKV